VIVSGPSGVGKTSLMQRVFRSCPLPLVPSVSATTRPPRPGEVDGVDYHFLTEQEFKTHQKRGEFLESFQVFAHGHWYGTLLREVTSGLAAGKWVVLEIDVQGALCVMQKYPHALSIFVRPESLEQLGRRLRGRGTETQASLQRRLGRAKRDLDLAGRYRYQVVNDQLDRAVQQVCDILAQESEANRDAQGASRRSSCP
jgi:guanylate kinase